MAFATRNKILNPKLISLLLLIAWTYAFWPTLQMMFKHYVHSGYDYQGFLVAPALLLLVTRKSKALKRAHGHYSSLGLLLLLLCAAIWLFATILELSLPMQIASITMLYAIVLMNFGRKISSILFMPLLCLFFLLPVGEACHNALQHSFTWALTQLLTLCKQAVYWNGQQITISSHIYDIGAYLSSMHHVLLLGMCGAVYAMLKTKNNLAAICIQISFILMPLCMLFIFMFSYILIRTFFNNMQFIYNHISVCGWILTFLGAIHAVMLGHLLADRKNVIHRQDNIDWRDMHQHSRAVLQPLLLGVVVLLLTPNIASRIINDQKYNQTTLVGLPQQIQNWSKQTVTSDTHSVQAKFQQAQDTINLSIAHQATPITATWQEVKHSNKVVKLDSKKISVHETVLHNTKNKYKILWQVNFVNGHYTSNEKIAKALRHMYNLADSGSKSGIISISTDAGTELNQARDRLKNFMQDFTASTKALG